MDLWPNTAQNRMRAPVQNTSKSVKGTGTFLSLPVSEKNSGDAHFEVGAAIAAQIGGLDKVPPTARKNQRCGPQGEVPCIFNEFRQQGSSSMVAGLSVRL